MMFLDLVSELRKNTTFLTNIVMIIDRSTRWKV